MSTESGQFVGPVAEWLDGGGTAPAQGKGGAALFDLSALATEKLHPTADQQRPAGTDSDLDRRA